MAEQTNSDTLPALFTRIQALCDASRALCAQSQAVCAESQVLCAESMALCAQSQALTWWLDHPPLTERRDGGTISHTPPFACPVELMRQTDGSVEIHVTRRDGTVAVILGPSDLPWMTTTVAAFQPEDSDAVQVVVTQAP